MRACHLVLVLACFITLDQVELKNAEGQWVTVIRPDRKIDLSQEEPAVRFFNNGRIPAGSYSNVRVHFTPEDQKQLILERLSDYEPALPVKKGTFIGISFAFDWQAPALSEKTIKEVKLTVDQDERIDGSDKIKLWS